MNKKYNAIIVFGRGVGRDGSLPESVQAYIEKCAQLFDKGISEHIVFCGKWSYSLAFTPPFTEAEAMAKFAVKLGIPEKAILKEDESYTIGSNCYFLKKRILEPKNWKRVLLVSMHPIETRALYNLEKVLGPEYSVDVSLADFAFPEPQNTELEKEEAEKMQYVRNFYKPFIPGDHESIYRAAEYDLQKNYKGKQKASKVL